MSQEIPFELISEITRPMLQKYADASGDHNQIHLDEAVAKKRGLPGVIAHGMLIAAMISERGLQYFRQQTSGEGYVSKFNSRFRAMVFPGDQISVGGMVKSASDEEWTLDLQAKNQKGEVTTSGVVTVRRVP